MARRQLPRRFPRTLRVNEVVRETIAEELERLSDPRLEMVTVTGVDVSPDLRHATVYYALLGREDETTLAALQSAAPYLRSALGRQVRMKYLPELRFREDPAIHGGRRIEEIIRRLHEDEATRGEAR